MRTGAKKVINYIVNNDLDLDDAISYAYENGYGDNIRDIDTMKEAIIDFVDKDDFGMAHHLLDSMWNDTGSGDDYWVYDFSEGTYKKPYSIGDVDELITYIKSLG